MMIVLLIVMDFDDREFYCIIYGESQTFFNERTLENG